jgi:uncharacterized protein (TIGR02246 family)
MSALRSVLVCVAIAAAWPAYADRTEDREAIEGLMWRYARALDTYNPEAYASVYTEDGQFIAGGNATKGRGALRAMIANFGAGRDGNPPRQLYHMTTDSWIEFIDETHARHHSYWLTMAAATGDTPPSVVAVGVGVDELVRIDGEWLIRVRNVTPDE